MGTKIITFSDLHLEFKEDFKPPLDSDADIMVLAGDIVTFDKIDRLQRFLEGWDRPFIYVCGNHEYYNVDMGSPLSMQQVENIIYDEIVCKFPKAYFLKDDYCTINGVQFFGGTMWTDFNNNDYFSKGRAAFRMKDYKCISNIDKVLTPNDTVLFHNGYVEKLIAWLEDSLEGPRVIISHHSPVYNRNTQYANDLWPAYLSLDMPKIFMKYNPDVAIYGHTHECDDQICGNTRVISNQRGYPMAGYLCEGFDPQGKMVEV